MHTGYVERSNGMAAREKRSLDPSSSQEGQPDRKRPALASVIVEALKVDSLQNFAHLWNQFSAEFEEVERALAKLGPAKLNGRVSPKRIEGPDGRNLQLQFRSKLSLPLFTGGKVEGEQGAAIHVVLIDANTGHVVTSGPESSVKLDIVVLEGVGTLGELTFTDNSSWIRSRKFRLGLRVASGSCEGFRIREAKTDAFTVKDHRGELYKKHYPPALNDEVWRLEKIGKDGSFHKRLNKAGICTVEDFLRLVVRDPQKLRHILGSGMSNKMWEVLVEHSKTCVLSGKLYVYYPDEPRNVGVVFNDIYVLSGLIAGGQYHSVDSLSESHKVFVDTLVKKAYENWMHVIEYDGKSLLGFDQSKTSNGSQNDLRINIQDQPNSFDQLSLPNLPIPPSIPAEPPMNPGLTIGGYNDNISLLEVRTFWLLVRHTQQRRASLLVAHQIYTFEDIPEDEIRIRSHEMLENEDMQHLLRVFSMGGHGHGHGHASFNVNENNYAYSAYTPMTPSPFGFDVDRTRPSGKAVVGWLKLKAALRWGIFIRKKAAERRAQIVELDDF
ncbi:UNVERIFIED_CONTAM: Calmodulin-binding protein 60 C [Sesamum latifolium]|uniref:Calmodulin-binding protein 60 C n=1 Tax=Sesamum latifolium TaxID=2727402 RepID=A0AAW2WLX4_9LAMI